MRRSCTKLFMLLLVAGLSFSACNNNNTNPAVPKPPAPPAAVKLAAPTGLEITGTTFNWNRIANASGYTVDINGTTEDVSSNVTAYSLSALEPGDPYEIRITAKGNGTTYTNSDPSAAVSYLSVKIRVFDNTGEIGVITNDELVDIEQIEVDDPDRPGERYYAAYPMSEILAGMGIAADSGAAYIESWDIGEVPEQYISDAYATVTGFEDAYIAVVRMNTADDTVSTTSNFPRFVNTELNAETVLQAAGTVLLTDLDALPAQAFNLYAADELDYDGDSDQDELLVQEFALKVNGVTGESGYITKGLLSLVSQRYVIDPRNAAMHYVTYSLNDILALRGIPADSGAAYLESSDILDYPGSYAVTKNPGNTDIAVIRLNNNGNTVNETRNFPRFISDGNTVLSSAGTIILTDIGTLPEPLVDLYTIDEQDYDEDGILDEFVLPEFAIEINDGTNTLGYITKGLLTLLGQTKVTENASRHYIAHSMNEILALKGISADFGSAYLVASDDTPEEPHNMTVSNFDTAHIAVVRLNTADDTVSTTSNFPRFLPGDGYVSGDSPTLQNLSKITLNTEEEPQTPPEEPTPEPPSPGLPYELPADFDFSIDVIYGESTYTMTKADLPDLELQVVATAVDGGGTDFAAYPLTEILEKMGITGAFTQALGDTSESIPYPVEGFISDAYVAIAKLAGDVPELPDETYPRFLVTGDHAVRSTGTIELFD